MDHVAEDGLEMTQDGDSGNKDLMDATSNQKHLNPSPPIQSNKSHCKRHNKSGEKTRSASKKQSTTVASSGSGEGISSSSDDGDSMTSSDLELETAKKMSTKTRSTMKHKKAKKQRRKKIDTDSSEDSSSSASRSSDTEEDVSSSKVIQVKKAKKALRRVADDCDDSIVQEDDISTQAAMLQYLLSQGLDVSRFRQVIGKRVPKGKDTLYSNKMKTTNRSKKNKKKKEKVAAASKVAFKRVDQLWDNAIHDYKLTETADHEDIDVFDQYIFTVRRKFDWEHRYVETMVDIRSKHLKEALAHVMEGVKTISLHVAVPKVEPNMLFLYLEELRAYMKELKALGKTENQTKASRAAATKAKHLKILIKYLDADYADTKKTLYPMLDNGTISFDLLWALYKPNTVAYTTTYGDTDEARAFKITSAQKESHFSKGTWYQVDGKYLEYTGKTFGMASMHSEVEFFKGSRSITSLPCYPLKYHKNAEGLRKQLIGRGKKFVTLKGMNYRHHKGMAYMKKKRQVLRVCIDGRVMVDPAIFRRINPNYLFSTVKPKEDDEEYRPEDSEDDSCDCDRSDSDHGGGTDEIETEIRTRRHYKLVRDPSGRHHVVEVEHDESGEEVRSKEKLEETADGSGSEKGLEFDDEELLIASPVVLGFAFNEKLWLELSVSGIEEVRWNEGAFESLVLPANQKSLVKALVSSHKFHPSKNIDDIIANKGLGCTMVLHGPPGTGKTLTAEGIAELLRAPLYMVSAGELGTDPKTLERELQNILDIAHSWGAILLLDEADVFMEKRSLHDIHRNSLVGIFLRLLEYFQGILFLTTNRVETFDDAFQSRIHVALRYGELDFNAKRSVWKMFISKIRDVPDNKVDKFDDSDFDRLARRNLNGRQIKNAARAAQALAVDEDKPLGMIHVEEVLRISQAFEQDLRGGTGYEDAMRSYT